MSRKWEVSDLDDKLIQAVCQGNAEAVRVHAKEGAQISRVYKGRSLLCHAAAYGYVDVMLALMEAFQLANNSRNNSEINSNKRGVDEDIATPDGMRELQWDSEIDDSFTPDQEGEDVWSRQYKWYAEILDKKEDALCKTHIRGCRDSIDRKDNKLNSKIKDFLSLQDTQNRQAMHYAAERGSVEAVRILLDYGCSVNVSDADALTPLHLAAHRGHLDMVLILLDNGAVVNAKSTDKLTPLHYASAKGHIDIVRALVARGANVNSLDSGEQTPLALAVSRDLTDVVQELIRLGARINTEDIKGNTPLSQAVWLRNVEMARLLIDNGAKLIPCNDLLHSAILFRHAEMIELLVNEGALLNAKNGSGMTPLLLATHTAQPDVVRLLLERGANIELSYRGLTPLVVCLTENTVENLEVVKVLLDAGADIGQFAIWSFESDAFTSAMIKGKTKSAILLLAYGAKVSNQNIIELFDDFEIIKALVVTNNLKLSHIRPPLDFRNIVDDQAWEWLDYQRMNPLTLLQQSRIAVRHQKPPQLTMFQFVHSLDIPAILKGHLMLSEFFDKDIFNFD